jgi:hypothetical protein
MNESARTGIGIQKAEPKQQRWTLKRILGTAGLLAAALSLWAFTAQVNAPAGRGVMFAGAAACMLGALWPLHGAALLLASFMALGMAGTVETINAWNVTATLLWSFGAFHLLRRCLTLAWIGASLSFWAMAGAVPWLIYVALGLVFIGLGTAVARPFMIGKRGTGTTPAPHLSNGALIEVPERTFRFRSGRRLLQITLALSGLAVLVGGVLWFNGSRENGLFLLIIGAVVGFSFAFSVWLGSRSRYRVDSKGIHGRVFLCETTIPWTQVCDLFLRYQYMPGLSQRWVYYCILSPKIVIAFPNTLVGADELRGLIENATGMKWPQPAQAGF